MLRDDMTVYLLLSVHFYFTVYFGTPPLFTTYYHLPLLFLSLPRLNFLIFRQDTTPNTGKYETRRNKNRNGKYFVYI